jgi:RimJ/RimL family protein N-acetyltransferase
VQLTLRKLIVSRYLVYTFPYPYTDASMRVLQKCGYALEGILKSEVHKGGHYFDIHQPASLISGEWTWWAVD